MLIWWASSKVIGKRAQADVNALAHGDKLFAGDRIVLKQVLRSNEAHRRSILLIVVRKTL